MDVKLVDKGETGELLLAGNLDTKTAKDADTLFSQMVDRFQNLTLNMQSLNYISSAGLRCIRNVYMKLNQKGGTLSIIHVNENVMEVFEMTGIAGLLGIK